MEKVIVVIGPTSVGKTKMGVALAKKFNGEVISGDSMQIYKQMDIGTAKVTEEEKEGAGAGAAPEGFSGYDRARGDKIQHRPFYPRQPVSHGDDAEKLSAHDG